MYSQQVFNEYDQGTDAQSILCRSFDCGAYLPASDTKQEADDIRLLLLLKLLEILVCTHLCAKSAVVARNFRAKHWSFFHRSQRRQESPS